MQMPPVDRPPNWRPQGADLYPNGAAPARSVEAVQPHVPQTPQAAANRPAQQSAPIRAPETPSAPLTLSAPQRDWTAVKKKQTLEEPQEPPKEPIYKQLLELIRSMWRASGSAVEAAQDVNKMTLQERMAQQVNNEPLTYTDPKVRRTSSL